MKDPNCGCCSAWIDILDSNGLASLQDASMSLMGSKPSLGIFYQVANTGLRVCADVYMLYDYAEPQYVSKAPSLTPCRTPSRPET